MATTLRFDEYGAVFAAARALRTGPGRLPPEGARRALNVVVAILGLILTLPLTLLIAAAIKLTSPGPIFYVQTRIGLDRRLTGRGREAHDLGGRPFRIYKFRTMAVGGSGRQTWASPDDPRITRVGGVLRRFRLDELPQLWNVVLGDMNIVGPRPEQPAIVRELRLAIPDYRRRHRVRPGITGLAQVRLPYDQSVDDVRRKVSLDLEYIHTAGTARDLEIMLRTPAVMLGHRLGW